MSEDSEKLNRIEELKSKLFSRNYKTETEHRDSFAEENKSSVPDSWQSSVKEKLRSGEKMFTQSPVFKSFFLFSLGFFLLAVSYASYVFFAGENTVSKENIEISVIGNAFVAGGEELSLVIGISNNNGTALDLVDLIIEYPKSSSKTGPDTSTQMERYRESLGTIPGGAIRNENVKLVLFGEQGSVVPIKIAIEYRVQGSNAIFVVNKPYEVSINSTPVNLSINGPSSISPNQDVVLDIKTSLNATKALSGVMLKVEYPVGFQFDSATPEPSIGNNIWELGDLAPGGDRSLSIKGQMIDVFEGEEKTFRVLSGTQSRADKSVMDLVFNSVMHTLTIKKPFLETTLLINGEHLREYAVDSKTMIRGEIDWKNNLDTNINDLEIRAKIVGNAVDRKTISGVQGFYNSGANTIVWDKSSVSQFREINPGDSGSVAFSFSPLSLLSTPGQILASPSISIVIDISGRQSVEGFDIKDLANSEQATINIVSDVGFATKALYGSGPFKNTGPTSPKVGEETTYTIVWSVSNSSNNISKAKVTATIPSWIRFVGTSSPSSENLSYNASKKEITWNIGSIPKGTGITSGSKEVAFQVGFTPSLSQVSSIPVIINDATLTGHDDFANVDVRANKGSLRTRLESDPTFPDNGGFVVE